MYLIPPALNIVGLYEKIEKLAHLLPEKLRGPIVREITPLKTLFLMRRPPRLLLLGDRATSRTALANALFGAEVGQVDEDHVQSGAWQLFEHEEHGGGLRMLDGRRPAGLAMLRRALHAEAPDACLFLHTEPRAPVDLAADCDHAAKLFASLREHHGSLPPVLGVAVGNAGGEEARRHLHESLDTAPGLGEHLAGVFVIGSGEAEVDRFANALAAEVPAEARLDMARVARLKPLQREMAQGLVRSVSAICGAVGTQPIPLADFPIITSLQVGMVAGIMHISGREMSMRLAGEWIGAIGANIGVGLVLREGARALAKIVPIWGDLASGGIAAAGTLGIGRAATAYFIDGVSLTSARDLFRRKAKKPVALLKE